MLHMVNIVDVLLLANVFERFRDVCMECYGQDPAHYYTAPGLSWDAMLKPPKCNRNFSRTQTCTYSWKKAFEVEHDNIYSLIIYI